MGTCCLFAALPVEVDGVGVGAGGDHEGAVHRPSRGAQPEVARGHLVLPAEGTSHLLQVHTYSVEYSV